MNAYDHYTKLDSSAARTVYFRATVCLMDDVLREALHAQGLSEADFLRAYCAAHAEGYGEDFIVN
jgi:hypothetical protein